MLDRRVGFFLTYLIFCIVCMPFSSCSNEDPPAFEELNSIEIALAKKYNHNQVKALLGKSEQLYIMFNNLPVGHLSFEQRKLKGKEIAAYALRLSEETHSIKVVVIFFVKVKKFFLFFQKKDFSDNFPFYLIDLQLEKTIDEVRRLSARDPTNTQIKADLGWLYIQSGKFDDGFPLLLDAPIEPSYDSALLFPNAKDTVERRQLYLKTLNAFDAGLDGTRLVLGHIFVAHLSIERIIDKELIFELEGLVSKTSSPLIYDALREFSYAQRDWTKQLRYAEAVISSINTLALDIQDPIHLSHFYYNSACGYSIAGDYDMSAKRLSEAFSINDSLYSWSLQDPDLENLRTHLGMEQFEKIIGRAQ